MAQCNEPGCGAEMLTADGCLITWLIFYGGAVKKRIPYGKETRFKLLDDTERCHDCNCKPGELHHSGCDMEECPLCHGQLLSCEDSIYDVIGQIPNSQEEDIDR